MDNLAVATRGTIVSTKRDYQFAALCRDRSKPFNSLFPLGRKAVAQRVSDKTKGRVQLTDMAVSPVYGGDTVYSISYTLTDVERHCSLTIMAPFKGDANGFSFIGDNHPMGDWLEEMAALYLAIHAELYP